MDPVNALLPINSVGTLASSLAGLTAGKVLDATVVAQLDHGLVRLSLADTLMDILSEVTLAPGTAVKLAVTRDGPTTRLVLLDGNPAQRPLAVNSTATLASGPATAPPPAVSVTSSTPSISSTSLPSPAATTSSVPAMTAGSPTATPPFPSSLRTPTQAPTEPALSVRAAVTITLSPEVQPSIGPDLSTPTTRPALPTDFLVPLMRIAAAKQDGVAPLIANLAALGTGEGPTPPAPTSEAAARITALTPSLEAVTNPERLKEAVARSGLFLEANLAQASNAAPPPADDLKSALLILRQVLGSWVNTARVNETPVRLPPLPPLIPEQPQDKTVEPGKATEAKPAPATVTLPPQRPPPPLRDALPIAQPVVAPSIAEDMTPLETGRRLVEQTDAALARQTLMQIASLPDAPQRSTEASQQRWVFDLPFMTGQGPGVAQFEISRDGHRGADEPTKPVWRARFSIDIEPLGPVHAQIALHGTRTAVTFWAEREDAAERLKGETALLAEALREAELEPADILCRLGTPPAHPARAGRFVDQAS